MNKNWDDKKDEPSGKDIGKAILGLIMMIVGLVFLIWFTWNLLFYEDERVSLLENAPEGCHVPNEEMTWDQHNECYFYFLEEGYRMIRMPDDKRELVTIEQFEILETDCVNNGGEWENISYRGFHGYCSIPQDLNKLLPEFMERYERNSKFIADSEKGMDIEIGI